MDRRAEFLEAFAKFLEEQGGVQLEFDGHEDARVSGYAVLNNQTVVDLPAILDATTLRKVAKKIGEINKSNEKVLTP